MLHGPKTAPLTSAAPPRVSSRDRQFTWADETPEDGVGRSRYEVLSRALNLTLAAFGLLLLFPLMLLIALAVKLTSKGPIFYSQTRIGVDQRWNRVPSVAERHRRTQDLGGRVFRIYKFRTMCVHAEHLSGAVWAAKEDPRVTRTGQFLRRYRLDELPQLFNVVRGDMNIVGPRPERPSIFLKLRGDIPGYHTRQRAKPGITGLAQINQHYDICLDDVRRKLHFDLQYIRERSMARDVLIMVKTIPVVLFRRGGW